MPDWILLLLGGAFGSIARDIVIDGRLKLPFLKDGDLVLGFVGGAFVGSFVGFSVDHSVLTAVLSGYVGTSAIRHLLPLVPPDPQPSNSRTSTTTMRTDIVDNTSTNDSPSPVPAKPLTP